MEGSDGTGPGAAGTDPGPDEVGADPGRRAQLHAMLAGAAFAAPLVTSFGMNSVAGASPARHRGSSDTPVIISNQTITYPSPNIGLGAFAPLASPPFASGAAAAPWYGSPPGHLGPSYPGTQFINSNVTFVAALPAPFALLGQDTTHFEGGLLSSLAIGYRLQIHFIEITDSMFLSTTCSCAPRDTSIFTHVFSAPSTSFVYTHDVFFYPSTFQVLGSSCGVQVECQTSGGSCQIQSFQCLELRLEDAPAE